MLFMASFVELFLNQWLILRSKNNKNNPPPPRMQINAFDTFQLTASLQQSKNWLNNYTYDERCSLPRGIISCGVKFNNSFIVLLLYSDNLAFLLRQKLRNVWPYFGPFLFSDCSLELDFRKRKIEQQLCEIRQVTLCSNKLQYAWLEAYRSHVIKVNSQDSIL